MDNILPTKFIQAGGGNKTQHKSSVVIGLFLCMFICSDGKDGCRIVKDIVCFHAANFQQVTEKLLLDLHEPPMSQVLQRRICVIFSYLIQWKCRMPRCALALFLCSYCSIGWKPKIYQRWILWNNQSGILIFFLARCHSCHPTSSVSALKEYLNCVL